MQYLWRHLYFLVEVVESVVVPYEVIRQNNQLFYYSIQLHDFIQ